MRARLLSRRELVRPAAIFPAMILGVCVSSGSMANAALITDTQSSNVQTTYDGNIVNNGLINNGSTDVASISTTGSIAAFEGDVLPGNSWANLTDGLASTKLGGNDLSHDTFFDPAAIATGPSVTYSFDTLNDPQGYSITQIRSIYGWDDTATRSNQDFNVFVKLVGGTTFVPLTSVNYAPFTNDFTPSSSQVTLTDSSGFLITGASALRFTFPDNGGSGQMIREIDAAGAPSIAAGTLSVPEPASMGLIGTASVLLLGRRRRRSV